MLEAVKGFSMNTSHINDIRATYELDGYVVIQGLIDKSLADSCVQSLEQFKRSRTYYFSQSRHIWENSNGLTEDGFLKESIQSPSKLFLHPNLQKSVIKIISDRNISKYLTELTAHRSFVRWQDMLFDRSTGTVDHADEWYLNTYPSGGLVGVWIALEDIDERAGRFFVAPRNQLYQLPKYDDMEDHQNYIKTVQQAIVQKNIVRHAPALRKGDVLFWAADTIHGSYSQREKGYSRKSITVHYHPIGYGREKGGREYKDIIRYLKRMLPTANENIFLDDTDPSTNFFKKSYLKFRLKKMLNIYKPTAVLMSRDKVLK
jgi:phytanoyl-CoA hydroxylase